MSTNGLSVHPQESQPVEAPARSWGMTQIATAALAVALSASNLYLLVRADVAQSEMAKLRTSFEQELTAVRAEAARNASAQAARVDALRQQMEETGAKSDQAAALASKSAASAARQYSDQLAARLALQQREQLERHQMLSSQLGEMKQAATQTEEKMTGIATDVTIVRGEVAQTKTELDRTIQDLRSVRGDLGVQSGLIATNAKELAALRSLGERYYHEFSLARGAKQPQRIGEVALQLKKSDDKRNRYTIGLIANDRRVEKKDRTINEPVQFYISGSRIPYEIVVNEVHRDRIVGYLAAPKVREVRQ